MLGPKGEVLGDDIVLELEAGDQRPVEWEKPDHRADDGEHRQEDRADVANAARLAQRLLRDGRRSHC
jgi:hypothetical protein